VIASASSRTKTRALVRRLGDRVAPQGTTARTALSVGRRVARDGAGYVRRLHGDWENLSRLRRAEPTYAAWLEEHRLGAAELAHQINDAVDHPHPISVQIVVLPPTDPGGPPGDLKATLRSLAGQTASGWGATVVLPPGQALSPSHDHRVRVVSARVDDPLDAALSVAAEGDPAELVLVMEAGDLAEPDLVFQLLAHAWDDPLAALFHWDDDVLDPDGAPSDPLFRPSWSPDTLLGTNYLGRSFAVRRSALQAVGERPANLGDAAWWDLLLRLDLDDERVTRIARVLTHVVRRPMARPDEALAVVRDHLERSGRRAELELGPAGVRVRWELDRSPHVTVVIPTRHNREMLGRCLPSLARTDYPSFDVIVVDNGGHSPSREAWYEANGCGLELDVRWWHAPFNYSQVNNVAAAGARGEVLIFLNDDTELVDPGWMRELVGWAVQPDIGLAGLQLLDGSGRIQHGGVVVGVNGFADHLFVGLEPHSDTIFGSTDWYRDVLSVTAACVAVERSLFEQTGGFDERFVLCGSDVVLGLDTRFAGYRNLCSPSNPVLHLESVTRGTSVPTADFHASYWRYQKYLRGGDPYFSPNLARHSGAPALASLRDDNPMAVVGNLLGRDFSVFRQRADEAESIWLSDTCRADDDLVDSVRRLHARTRGRAEPASINWFFPDIDSPFYGGLNTALRIADHLARHHEIAQRFVVMASPNPEYFRSALQAAFPAIADMPMTFVSGPTDPALLDIPFADVSIATLWVTAYSVARFPNTRRKFYLIQDFEPQFYPAGTNYALAEEGYRLGLYGLCNTERLLELYSRDYDGVGGAFMPAVDDSVFHARGRKPRVHDDPVTVFVYARPGHWRNCWELASLALTRLKDRLGDGVRIVTAGSWARPDELGRGIEHLGLLDYRDTGELYRRCDVGVALTVSAHPSYLPLELMACGVPVVAFDNPAGDWILHHEVNSLRCRRTVDGLGEALERLVVDGEFRDRLGSAAEATIAGEFSNWERALAGVYDILADPEGEEAERVESSGR